MRNRAAVGVWVLLGVGGCDEGGLRSLRVDPDATAALPSTRCSRAEDCDDNDACTADLCVVGNVCDHERVVGCVAPRRCARATDCDDGVSCTRDRCLVSGLCDSVADESLCAVGTRCDARRGCEGSDAGAVSLDTGVVAASDRPVGEDRVTGSDGAALTDVPALRDVLAAADVPVTDVPTASDAGEDPRSGTYTLVPALAYACQDEVFKTPVLSLAVASLTVVARPGGVSVTWPGGSAALTGPAIAGDALEAAATLPHPDCTATLTLRAGFAAGGRLNGTLALGFSGFGCALTSCEARTLTVQGLRMR